MFTRTLTAFVSLAFLATTLLAADERTDESFRRDEASRRYATLIATIDKGDAEALRPLLVKSNVDETIADGMTPLMRAIHRGHPELVPVILDAGANPNVAGSTGATPLHYAAWRGDVE